MLCGIGGRTIEEAKRRLSYAEFCDWVRYRNARGTLNHGLRAEWAMGTTLSFYANSKSQKGGFKLFDFTPHIEEPPVSLEQAMENWK